MKKHLIYAAIILSGFPVGYLGVDLVMGQPDRAKTAIEIFKGYCIPFARKEDIQPGSELTSVSHLPSERFWIEPKSKISLFLSARKCTVTDLLEPMNPEEREEFEIAVSDAVANFLPMLKTENQNWPSEWDSFHIWSEHRPDDPRHWGATLIRVAPDGAEASTSLSVMLPLQ